VVEELAFGHAAQVAVAVEVLLKKRQGGVLDVEVLAQHLHQRLVYAARIVCLEQRQNEAARSGEELVVVPGRAAQVPQTMTQVDVAFAQYADLAFHQGHGGARGVGNVQQAQEFGVALKIVRVLDQKITDAVIVHARGCSLGSLYRGRARRAMRQRVSCAAYLRR
jgi:hypothetical protein